MILQGDALTWLRQINDETVDCCVTSPPYYALRDYKTEGQIGLEKTFQEYLDKLIQIFTEVRRVLKKSGTCWVVMGDTYAGTGHKNGYQDPKWRGRNGQDIAINNKVEGVPDKSLLMIPSRFAIAMIDSGWILRNDIIWYKPNCMPSSAKDRFTVDYEHIFFFVKSKKYYFKTQMEEYMTKEDRPAGIVRNRIYEYDGKYGLEKKNMPPIGGLKMADGQNPVYSGNEPPWKNGRIKRTVWKINTYPFPEAHFAVFPEELVKQCLEPGCPPNGVLLDPFMGAGTVPLVAEQTNRRWIGIELNPSYIKIAKERLKPYTQQLKLTSPFYTEPIKIS